MDGSIHAERPAETSPPPVTMRLEQIEALARVCHEANRYYCQALGDLSQRTWDTTSEDIRRSAIDGVRFVLANPDAPQSAAHDNWLRFKAADGWRFGPVKDPAAKTHPCFLPYHQLPLDQRRKDGLFRAIVQALTSVD
jgi:hypothetical protein